MVARHFFVIVCPKGLASTILGLSRRFFFMRLVSAAMLLLVSTLAVFAQNDRGTITGEVKDQAGAVVPGAAVTATNAASGSESKTTSTATGNYTIPSLTAGIYTLTVEVKGFKKFIQQNIEVQVSITNRIDVSLEVGATSESVTITAEAAQLKTENAEQSTVIQTNVINGLPLNFGGGGGSSGNIRSPFAFNVLSPGVSGTGADSSAVNGQTGFRIQVEGQDTTSQNDANWTSTVSHASVDAIEEFSLQTSNFSAEFSQVGGGLYNFTTKSGTNQFHGGGYEYLTNEDLDAYRPYFTPTVPSSNPRSRKNDFGGTIGGPVWIPKIYNGRNKTFFFFSEEVFRNVTYPNGSAFLYIPHGGHARRQLQFQRDLPGTEPRYRSGGQRSGQRRHLRSRVSNDDCRRDYGAAVSGKHHSAQPIRPVFCKGFEPDSDADKRQPGQQLGGSLRDSQQPADPDGQGRSDSAG
jgi:hypothetical protein